MPKKQSNVKPEFQEDIIKQDLADHAERNFFEYALSVVKGRAIPFVHDGLKPVQRRILFSMKELHLSHTAKPKKSARVVGDVIGKYHPHGDSAVYEAMVRTSQDFSLRYPLVIGEGNFGSRDGDGAAAMRYTEARLSSFSELFLSELDKGTVDWRSNYDNSSIEPSVLPCRVPNLLLNGASGIGVGIACEIPSHNLTETVDAAISLIKNPSMTLDDLMTYIPGPDFPTGAQIISSSEEIKKVYHEGRGALRVRARHVIENEGQKNWRVVFYEIPYKVSCQQIMEELDDIFNPKPKDKNGKKIFTPEQLRLKNLFSGLIEKFTDGSDKDHAVRLVFEPKSYKQDPAEIVQNLLAYTSLESNHPVNLVAVGLDMNPCQKNLLTLLTEWTTFRIGTVQRRTQYEYDQAAKRLHILEGRQTILDHIEEVIQILKKAEKPKEDLMARFKLSEIQAEDVLEIRLRQLARLEHTKIANEIADLQNEIKRLSKLLESKTALKNQVIKELELDKKTYGDARRTIIQASEKITLKAVETPVSNEPITVAISEKGWIRAKPSHQLSASDFSFKTGDTVKHLFKISTLDYLFFFDEQGKVYSYPAKELPLSKSSAEAPISSIIELSSRLIYSLAIPLNRKIVLASSSGYGFITKASDLISRVKGGKALISLDPGASMLMPFVFNETVDLHQTLFTTLSSNGRLLGYRASEINEMTKGKGLALCGLDPDCTLSQVAIWTNNEIEYETEGLKKSTILATQDLIPYVQVRSSSKKGKPLDTKKRSVRLKIPPFGIDDLNE